MATPGPLFGCAGFASGSGLLLSIRRYRAPSADAAAIRLGICVGSIHKLIREGVLPATQLMQSAPVAALETEAVKTGARENRRPPSKFYKRFQEDKTL